MASQDQHPRWEDIERYLEGEMRETERLQFEKEMSFDEQLAATVREHRLVADKLRNSGRVNRDFSRTLQVLEELRKSRQHRKVRKMVFGLAAAAAIVTLVVVILIPRSSRKSSLFATYFQPYDNVIAPVTRDGTGSDSVLAMAMRLYENALWSEAYAQFAAYGGDSAAQVAVSFYKAQCLLASDEYARALSILETIEDGPWQDKSAWYSALAHLGLGDTSRAIALLTQISRQAGEFKQPATELLGEFPVNR